MAERANEIDANAPVTEQASAWWILLNEGNPTEADQRAFAEWAIRSPERISAYLRAAQVAHVFRSPGTQWPDTPVHELIRTEAPPSVTRLPAGRGDTAAAADATPPWRPMPLARFAFAALFATIVVALFLYVYPRPERFETALGEQHSVVLSDGSLVTLNTASAIKLNFDRTHRRITLVSGEALFQVAHDATRPFEVAAGDTTVRAVGTKFNVDRHSQALEVTVVEGRVEVSTRSERVSLGAGEQLTLAPQSAPKVARASVAAATAWTQRQLVFENQSLAELAAEFNRYNRQVIDIQSAELRSQLVTGVFQSNDPETFLAFLRRIPGVSVEMSADNSRYVVRESGEP
jgi:transmembrane sensor